MHRTILILVLACFGTLSAIAMWRHGYLGVFEHQFASLAGLQVLADLGIALGLVMLWMWRDARASGRQALPWIVLTLAAGSFGPLLYLLTRRSATAPD
jgi:hypothetical protein